MPLKEALATTPKAQTKLRDAIRINMDRWRWLPRDLGPVYLITNVPEFQLRLAVNGRNIRTYRTIVGKPGAPPRRNWPKRSKRWCSTRHGPCRNPSSWAKAWGNNCSPVRAPGTR
jgi:hypothetical protein